MCHVIKPFGSNRRSTRPCCSATSSASTVISSLASDCNAICIFVAPFEQGEIGPALFRAACNMGLEGLVSKRRDRPYEAGRSKHWLKVKNRTHPAMERVMDSG
jgi:hypothetical protein